MIDESWGNFGGGSSDEAAPAATDSKGPPKVDLDTFYLSRVRDFNRFVASFRKPGNGPPTLYFLHDLLPHTPWLYFPDGRARAVSSTNAPGRNGELWFNGQLATQAWQRHLLQVGYTDKLLGQVHRAAAQGRALGQGARDRHARPRDQLPRRRPAPAADAQEPGRARLHAAVRQVPGPVGGPGGRLAARDDARHPPDDRRRARDQDPVARRRHLGAAAAAPARAWSTWPACGSPTAPRSRSGGRRSRASCRCSAAAAGARGSRAPARTARLVGRSVSTLAVAAAPGRRGARGRDRQPVPAALPARLGARALTARGNALGRAGRTAGRARAERPDRRGQRRLPQPRRRPGALLGARGRARVQDRAQRGARVRARREPGAPDARRRRDVARLRRRARRARAGRTAGSAGTCTRSAGRGLGGEQLALELLPAVRAHDAVFLGHESQASKAQAVSGVSSRSSSSPTRTAKRAESSARSASKCPSSA